MRLPKIDNLDLRDPEKLKIGEFDFAWNWPVFPEHIKRFIAGDPWDNHSRKVAKFTITVDVSLFQHSLKRAHEITQKAVRDLYATAKVKPA